MDSVQYPDWRSSLSKRYDNYQPRDVYLSNIPPTKGGGPEASDGGDGCSGESFLQTLDSLGIGDGEDGEYQLLSLGRISFGIKVPFSDPTSEDFPSHI